MFFHLSKVGWFLIEPSNALVFLLAAGLLLLAIGRLRRLAWTLLVAGIGGLLLCGFSPLGNWLILPLDERFPAWDAASGPPDGIIVLGGSFDTGVSTARSVPALNEAGERLTAFAGLARRYREARLAFAGGSGELFARHESEASIAGTLFRSLGLDVSRIVLEDESRNTWENAVFLRDLLSPREGERWLLVTSAWHMPRAVGTFRAAGFEVEAYPVDHRTRGPQDVWRPFGSLSEGLRRVDVAVREWVGLAAYRATGRTGALLPGP